MSHELTTRANGFTEFASTDATSWHGLGQQLQRGASIEEWQRAAGMDWHIQRAAVRYPTGRDQDATQWATIEDSHVLMRSDTKASLGIVSASFKVVQPHQILETLASETRAAGFELETAGTLFGGRRFWALASDGEQAAIVPGDLVRAYTLLVTATDGTMKTTGKKTTVRVVCNNTLSCAMGSGKAALAISHRSVYNADDMRAALGLVHDESFTTFAMKAKRMADKQVTRDRAEVILFNLLADDKAKAAKDVAKVSESLAFQKILGLFLGEGKGAQLDGVKGTAWGLLNAVTEYADHKARATSDDNRTASAWFGAGDALKDRAALALDSFATA